MSNNSIQRFSSLKFSRMLKRNKTISQINVTPMVDVMLVLLVIFMITAPLLKVGVPVNLPKTKAKERTNTEHPAARTAQRPARGTQRAARIAQHYMRRAQRTAEHSAERST